MLAVFSFLAELPLDSRSYFLHFLRLLIPKRNEKKKNEIIKKRRFERRTGRKTTTPKEKN